MSFDGRAIANFILDFCEERERRITNLSLQKIVFFCHAWSLIGLRKSLVKHQFEAWQFGPVLQYLYREFRDFDRKPIVGRAMGLDPSTGERRVVKYDFDAETLEFLTRVVDFYSRLSASELVKLSHAEGGPWDIAWNHQSKINPGMKIDNNFIAKFYSRVNAPFFVQ